MGRRGEVKHECHNVIRYSSGTSKKEMRDTSYIPNAHCPIVLHRGHSERGQPPNKGQAESTHVYIFHRKSSLREDNLSTKNKTKFNGPESALIKRFHCSTY